jgi:ABC-type nitrate/sulfonate/bicarbonate transport system ATPase subunit
MPSFVEIRGIRKEFTLQDGSKNIVLKDINLEIQQGDFVSLIGHSGCGKSTLLNIVAGLEKPTQGQVRVDGSINQTTIPRSHGSISELFTVTLADCLGKCGFIR